MDKTIIKCIKIELLMKITTVNIFVCFLLNPNYCVEIEETWTLNKYNVLNFQQKA